MKPTKIITVIGERDEKGRLWILRTTDNGRMDVLPRKFRRRDAAVRAAQKIGGKVQFWHG
jgi:hypothetical protein